ncbi:prosaposin-like isoform X2 [Carya illinoinensis]|uniref:prosaposin-like isoform X2 n=1 Tax=Carya illinoinensis TaxID=32201 RepID=UPI001C726A75|nr:prosaposin-like isoform X2 [Carya illinoinensis]
MDVRVGLLLLVVLGASWACDARQLVSTELHRGNGIEISVMEINYQDHDIKVQSMEDVLGNDKVCTLCEEFASKALDYFAENKTQTEILAILHLACSQCITLVDYYAHLFFLEVSTLQPEEFCRKFNLCQQIAMVSSQFHEDSCGLCHRAVSEIEVKLKDPDTQLEIVELLLKACNSMENYAKKCKKMVFEYGPLILANAEKMLETTDMCTTLHACNSPAASSNEASHSIKVSVLADS